MIKQFVIDNLLNKKGKINARKMNSEWFEKNGFSDYYEMIKMLFPNQESFAEKIKCVLYGINHCSECDKEIEHGRIYCSTNCANQSEIRSQKIRDKWKLDSTKKRQRQTFIKNNGCESNFHKKEVQDKIGNRNHWREIKISLQERYGVKCITDIPGVREKQKLSLQERYGVNHYSQKHLMPIWNKLNSDDYWNNAKNFCDVKDDLNDYLTLSNIYLWCHKMRPDWNFRSNVSSHHKRVMTFLDETEIAYNVNDRQLIKPLELDILIPSKNLAIEVNGIYWHTEERGKGKDYHNRKTELCEEKDVRLLHFWDFEIDDQFDFVKTKILFYLNSYQ